MKQASVLALVGSAARPRADGAMSVSNRPGLLGPCARRATPASRW